jgi:hypothetical protein
VVVAWGFGGEEFGIGCYPSCFICVVGMDKIGQRSCAFWIAFWTRCCGVGFGLEAGCDGINVGGWIVHQTAAQISLSDKLDVVFELFNRLLMRLGLLLFEAWIFRLPLSGLLWGELVDTTEHVLQYGALMPFVLTRFQQVSNGFQSDERCNHLRGSV